jgi:hypothetical protein
MNLEIQSASQNVFRATGIIGVASPPLMRSSKIKSSYSNVDPISTNETTRRWINCFFSNNSPVVRFST